MKEEPSSHNSNLETSSKGFEGMHPLDHSDRAPQRPLVPLSPLTHIAIFGAVIVPIALLPYLAVRRHLLSLHRKVAELGVANAALQMDVRTALIQASVRREEFYGRLRAMIEGAKKETEKIRIEDSHRDLVKARREERTRRDIEELLMEKHKTRYTRCSTHSIRTKLAFLC